MTAPSSLETSPDGQVSPEEQTPIESIDVAGQDQEPYEFAYGHGRMPLFMKIVWIGFLAFATWYLATNMLDALAAELG